MTLQLPINYWPQINLTHYIYNNSKSTCDGPIVSYSAFQSNCFNDITKCCHELSLRDNITLGKCIDNSVYYCAQVTNPPNAEVINALEWTLIVAGAITLIGLILVIFMKLLRVVCCKQAEYRELR